MAQQDIIVRLREMGVAAFDAAMGRAAGSIGGITREAEKAEGAVKDTGKAAERTAPNWRKAAGTMAKWAGGAAAVYGAKRAIQSSLGATQDLAKSTLTLQRATGLEAEQASAWASITKVRGIQTKQFQIGLVKLSKQMEAARSGNEKATKSFQDLGVSQDAIRQGDVQGVLMGVGDAMSKMTNPAEKAALAQTLFGRSGQALVPLLQGGTKGIQDQMQMAQKYGAVLGTDAAGSAKDLIARQREMQLAFEGLKISIGTALLPVITSLSQVLLSLTTTFQPLLRNTTLVKIAIGFLTAAFLAYKIAVIASTIASLGMIAVWAAIPIAIAAIAIALVVAYKRVGWFRNAVNAVFNWIKSHWPLLVAILIGPFGIAALLIIKRFGKIKDFARQIPGWFKNVGRQIVQAIVNGIKAAPHAILNALKSILPGGKVGSLVRKAIPGLQAGGVMTRPGWAMVGERGPEVVQLPGGARVSPLPAPALPAPALAGQLTTVANVFLDRRQIAQAVAVHTADVRARR